MQNTVFFAVLGIVAAILIGVTYYAGFSSGYSQTRTIVVEGVIDPNSAPVEFTSFWEVWSAIKNKYVDSQEVVDNQELLYGAVRGLVGSLDDPYSVFLSPEDADKFNADISGKFEGIGAEIALDDNRQLVIVAPLEGTPAFKAGLKSGDAILNIDGDPTVGISLDGAVKAIRGPGGSTVVLTIGRDSWDVPQDISIVRETIEIPTILFKQFNYDGEEGSGPIAYVRLYNFYDQAPRMFYKQALKITSLKSKGLVLDLRNNPGGYLDAAVSIGGWFVEKGDVIVTEEFQDESKNKIFRSSGPSLLKDMPVVVLINKGSASASEILAGALKEHNGTILIGETSFGKGTVQELVTLHDGSMLKLTIAHWVTPHGNIIQDNGISPNIEIVDDEETEEDEVLLRALRVLEDTIAN